MQTEFYGFPQGSVELNRTLTYGACARHAALRIRLTAACKRAINQAGRWPVDTKS